MFARMVIAAFLALMAVAADPSASVAWTHGQSLPPPAAICNVQTGTSIGLGAGTCIAHPATCDGVADDSQALQDYNAWATGTIQPTFGSVRIELLIPSGASCTFLNGVACGVNSTPSYAFCGITYAIMSAYGATVSFGPNIISLGGLALFDGGSVRRSTRLATVSAGASCVNLLTPAQGSIFTPGNVAYIGGFDLQGQWKPTGPSFGWPPNHYYFEWPVVSAVDTSHNCNGTSGGSVMFTAPLTNAYESTWPLYDPGTGANNLGDEGGPATLYVVDQSWVSTVDIRGGILQSTVDNQIQIIAKTALLTDVAMPGTACAIPSENVTWTNTNVTGPNCVIEVDKLIGSYIWKGGSVKELFFQSSSVNLLSVSGTVIGQIQGTPKKFVGDHATIGQIALGAVGFGRSNEFICSTCVINSITAATGVAEVGSLVGATWTLPGQNSGSFPSTMTAGVIAIPNTHGAVTWAVPGTNLILGSVEENEFGAFQVVDVTQDATNTYVQTTLSGGFPAIPLNGSNLYRVSVLGAPKFTCTSCTGSDPQIASLTQAPAGAPIYSFQMYTYTGAVGTSVQPVFKQWGNLAQINFNVTNAYGGAGGLSFLLAQFDNWPVILSNLSGVLYNSANSGPSINMKSVGNRQVTPSGVTCVGGSCTGDGGLGTLDAAGMWFTGIAQQGPQFTADASSACPGAGCPSITVTMQTNQGVVNPPN